MMPLRTNLHLVHNDKERPSQMTEAKLTASCKWHRQCKSIFQSQSVLKDKVLRAGALTKLKEEFSEGWYLKNVVKD